jgi:hypothetical protein
MTVQQPIPIQETYVKRKVLNRRTVKVRVCRDLYSSNFKDFHQWYPTSRFTCRFFKELSLCAAQIRRLGDRRFSEKFAQKRPFRRQKPPYIPSISGLKKSPKLSSQSQRSESHEISKSQQFQTDKIPQTPLYSAHYEPKKSPKQAPRSHRSELQETSKSRQIRTAKFSPNPLYSAHWEPKMSPKVA